MSGSSTIDDIEDEISSWGYSISLSDYERSSWIDEDKERKFQGGIGRGQLIHNGMTTIKLASEIHDLNVHPAPMGHLPTSTELIGASSENEITPMLRNLGLSGHDGEISSKKTRQVPLGNEEIKVDGKVPVILNGDLFNYSHVWDLETIASDEDEPFDPKRPLCEQFKTIKEFWSKIEQTKADASDDITSPDPKSSIKSSTTFSFDVSSDPSSSSVNTNEASSSEHLLEPLIQSRYRLYTPRELYHIKRMHPLRYYTKVNIPLTDGCFEYFQSLLFGSPRQHQCDVSSYFKMLKSFHEC